MNSEEMPLVFTPENEPYLGRHPLNVFDTLISSTLEENAKIAPRSHNVELTDHQVMAAQVIPQSISIALSIRELIRQGYLFGGHVLIRPLAERATILSYLYHYPQKIELWNDGWDNGKAPGLAKMFEGLQAKKNSGEIVPGYKLTAPLNSLIHGKPDSASWNLINLGDSGFAHAPSKILDRPELCDELCDNAIPWLAIVPAMMNAYFPNETT